MEGANRLVRFLLSMQDTVRLYHWQTRSQPRHVATCQLLAALAPLVDTLVETYIGRYQRPDFGGSGAALEATQLTDATAAEQLQAYGKWLKTDFPALVKPHDTDLLNIRDEMLAAIHQALYRFTLT